MGVLPVVVVKVGGSLFDHPGLGLGLRAYLDTLAPSRVLLVPGGGAVADAVRGWDRTHGLGEEAAHWLALKSLWTTGEFLKALVLQPSDAWFASHPSADQFVTDPPGTVSILDADAFSRLDDSLPHTWDVTTDSIAARAAVVWRAERLVLLKSTDVPPETPWAEAATRGWVDAHFPTVVAAAGLRVEAVNFRRVLDAATPQR